jgi:hypothetical protein
MGWLKGMLRGGGDELGWDDLVRQVVDAIGALRRYGPKGEVAFPEEVVVRITVAGDGVTVIQGFIDRPELDREVGAALANKCDVPVDALPARGYVVSAADRTTVTATEGLPKTWQFKIAGGDHDGQTIALPPGWTELGFGRGTGNELEVCDKTAFVSRRAGRLYRAGYLIEVASLDQADELVVRRVSGETLRPARTSRGRVVVKDGDVIELGDGRGALVRLVLERVS